MACEHLVPGFIALNQIKRSGDLCKAIGKLEGFNHACNSELFGDELDRRALCELLCCCIGQGNQQCVKNVLWQADAFHGYTGYYKAETPYLNKSPVMSRNEPARPTHSRPGGSRIPDVVVVKNPAKPPTQDNIQKVYEMKFPGDSYSPTTKGPDGMTQQDAYKDIFGNKIEKNPMDEKSCNCDERKKERILERAAAYQQQKENAMSLVDRVNSDTAKAVAVVGGSTAVGRTVEAIGGVAAALGRTLGLGF